ncbi:sugar phosphate isomerase/epimerase family protein [Sphingobacterium hungaricum]|uniref:Xylose isomerase n=1 Tax=Sphingobacterium hungaricum TaxID=2082723 RepID=A0A928YS92_9SPHI|nr:sugar phosphate isomerase/epimerase family protein [Sphingobacterium hungaricum]MBE8715005.1 xylose isomerase [Sphingobacterium hungaricum]
MNSRREFLKNVGLATAGLAIAPNLDLFAAKKEWFQISLAEWSLHRTLFKGDLKNIDFPEFTAKNFGIYGVEYVNQFFKDKAQDMTYLKDLNNRAKDNGVTNVLIMIDGEGDLGDQDETKRNKAIENHYKWIDAAHFLGCKAIRVNAAGKGTPAEVKGQVVKSLSSLADYGKKGKINVIVENHGGISSDGTWLSDVLKTVGKKNCGSLPDFGNFYEYDRYKGVEELMPFAKGVSAKANVFKEDGSEANYDYDRLMKIVKDAGYKGYIGIEFEGDKLSEVEGIKKAKALLSKYL